MPIDRDATLKQAEKLLRQGRLEAAIAEYVRLADDQPRDWSVINALGDLYIRAGDTARAAVQFTRIGDHLLAEGFLPKAAALYKKALKARPDDDDVLLRLSETAARQGLLADARSYLRDMGRQRGERGDVRGAAECVVRLGSLEDADAEAQAAAGAAAAGLGRIADAARLYQEAAAGFARQRRATEALAALIEAARLDPGDGVLRSRLVRALTDAGRIEEAREFLTREAAGDDPELLLAVGRIEMAAGRAQEARFAFTRALSLDPGCRPAVLAVAGDVAAAGDVDAAFGFVELAVDDALLAGDWDAAIEALQVLLARAPCVPALLRLVEIAVDAGRDAVMRAAQAHLADAYLESGQGMEARAIAEDLVASDPSCEAHADRLQRALGLMGVSPEEAETIVARCREREPDLTFDEPPDSTPDPVTWAGGGPEVTGADGIAEAGDRDRVVMEAFEVDLSDLLTSMHEVPPVEEAAAPPDLEDVFEGMRGRASRDRQLAEALDRYERGVRHLEAGRDRDAIADLEAAARTPLLRFVAAARLGRAYVEQRDPDRAVEWLERAAEAPAPSLQEGLAVLYELAAVLQDQGESARALAILMEIDTDAAAYRDVPQRIQQLKVLQAGP